MCRIIKILHIGLSPNRGGIETVVYSWWKQAEKVGFKIGGYKVHFDFINVYQEPIAFEREFRDGGAEVFSIPKRSKNPVGNYLGYKRIIESGNYDYVHCHIMSLSEPEPVIIVNSIAKKSLKKEENRKLQAIVHSHTIINKNSYSKLRRLIHNVGKWRLCGRTYHKIACGIEAGMTMFEKKKLILTGSEEQSSTFTVIENGIDRDKFRFNMAYRKEIRTCYGINEADIVIGLVGRASPEKNLSYAAASFADILTCSKQTGEIPKHYKLMLIGDLGCEEIRNLVRKYGIENDVILTGMVSDIYKYYSAMDVFYQPSLYEGVSVALIEAQASGLHCVVSEYVARESDVSGRVDFIKIDDPHNAYSCMPRDNGASTQGYERERLTCSFNPNYDLAISAEKIFQYYIDHL